MQGSSIASMRAAVGLTVSKQARVGRSEGAGAVLWWAWDGRLSRREIEVASARLVETRLARSNYYGEQLLLQLQSFNDALKKEDTIWLATIEPGEML